jgi:hypothetical protein
MATSQKYIIVNTTTGRYEVENTYAAADLFAKDEYISGTSGAGDADKPIKTNVSGLLDSTFLPSVVVRTDQDSTLASGVTIAVDAATTFTANDLISKAYADSIAAGFGPKRSVTLATDANIDTFVYDNGTSGVGATLTAPTNNSSYNTMQTVLLVVGDRVLVKDQTDTFENGIYAVSALGNDSDTSFTLTRSDDFDNNPDGEIRPGDYTFAVSGTNANRGYYQVDFTTGDAVGTDPITFSEFMAPAVYTAGDGIDIAANSISVDVTDIIDTNYGLTENANDIRINLESDGGLQFDASNKGIEIKSDSITANTIAITTTANGAGVKYDNTKGLGETSETLEVKLNPAGALEFDVTSGTIGVNVDNSSIEINGSNEIQVKADGIKDTMIDWGIGASQVSAADMPIADTGDVFTATDVEAALLELYNGIGSTTYTTDGTGVTAGDVVYISANNIVSKWSDITSNQYIVGIAAETKGAGVAVRVLWSGEIITGILTGATAGNEYYWSGSAWVTTFPSTAGGYVYQVGVAKNATDAVVQIEFIVQN